MSDETINSGVRRRVQIEQDVYEPESRQPGRKRSTKILLGGIALLALILIGIVPRIRRQAELTASAKEAAGTLPVVNVVSPRPSAPTSDLVLPGSTEGVQETVISARTSGFVRRRLVDIGDRVKEGQLLAEIETPELDQQLLQARQGQISAEQAVNQAKADLNRLEQQVNQAQQGLAQAKAGLEQAQAGLGQSRTNAELARISLRRAVNLVEQGVVSRQETDERQATFDVRTADVKAAQAAIRDKEANIGAQAANIVAKQADVSAQRSAIEARLADVNAQKANVQRIIELKSFSHVVAPFAGVVTERSVEAGSLVTPTGGTTNNSDGDGTGGALFKLARIDAIRTNVQVPQTYAAAMQPGLEAEVEVKELPQKKFKGRIVRTANALDQSSRTLHVEILLGNESGQLLPGMYAQVKFALTGVNNSLIVPSSALVVHTDGTSIITVGSDGIVRLHKVELGRDMGKEVEIVSGVDANELVVSNPTDALHEGVHVKANKQAPASEPAK